MHKVTVSAPGKIHLSGEHAVVYGKPAVLAAVSERVYVTVEAGRLKLEGRREYIEYIIGIVEKKYNQSLKNIAVTINSSVPVGRGMGSSAALAVALIGALREFLQLPWSPKEINELAHEAEKFQHGNPSGADTSVATFGGMIWFRREFEFLKNFWLLPFKIPRSFPHCVVIDTGRTESTKQLVAFVAERDLGTNLSVFNEMEHTTKQIVQAIHDENSQAFLNAISHNQTLLQKVGVVSESVQVLISEIEKAGGVAKISGAGGIKTGSGMVIAFHEKQNVLQKIAEKYKYPLFPIQLGGDGVRREEVVI